LIHNIYKGEISLKKAYERFTISLPKDLYDDFEHFRESLGMSRSDAIRKAMHSYMVRETTSDEKVGDIVGCITYILKHEHFTALSDDNLGPKYASIVQSDFIKSNDIQHEYQDVILSSMHIHLEDDNCMLIIPVKGKKERILEMKKKLFSLQSTVNCDFSIIGKEHIAHDHDHAHPLD
jgi:CopG family nickel-responsive transcriptional regulator